MSDKEVLAARRMRMLRLGVGWSAEKLSQEYGAAGAGELTRTTIAKIEGDMRSIRAGEVDGVAQVFGLTADDLMSLDGPRIFLSYAESDVITERFVATWLADRGFQLLTVETDEQGPGAPTVAAIGAAQAVVLLVSPGFLSSQRCRQELDLAAARERQLISTGLATRFIYALQLEAGLDLDDSGLSAYEVIDLAAPGDRSRDVALSKLGSSILRSTQAPDVRVDPPVEVQASPASLDRGEELGLVLNALNNSSGASFWLVTSPPGFGKSWLLHQLKERAAEPAAGGWLTSLVDLAASDVAASDVSPAELDSPEPAEAARNGQPDAMTVVRRLFGDIQRSWSNDQDYLRGVIQNTMRDNRPRLYLLDSAELLSADTIRALREYLGTVYDRVQVSGRDDARLAFVVASHRDDGWRGLLPQPEPAVLPLAGFGASAIQDALEVLAREIQVARSPAELRRDAELVQGVTEGVPELVLRSLDWIRTEQWVDIERLVETPQIFDDIMRDYIRDSLLAPGSLWPTAHNPSADDLAADDPPGRREKQLAALEEGLRVLVPYRFITASHVSYHADDESLRDALKEAAWDSDELWKKVTGTALLLPLDELWREIHPAVRRLLYRYFYTKDPAGDASVHAQAAVFIRDWARRLPGKEQAAGLVESIWHKAVQLRLISHTGGERELVEAARTLSEGISDASVYSQETVRNYAVQRMRNDDELQREAAKVKGLFDRLVLAVANPEVEDV